MSGTPYMRDPIDLDPLILGVAARNDSAFLLAATNLTRTEIAKRLGVPKQTLNDWLQEHHMVATKVYAAAGLKLVSVTADATVPEDMEAILRMAAAGLASFAPTRIKRRPRVAVDDPDTERGDDV